MPKMNRRVDALVARVEELETKHERLKAGVVELGVTLVMYFSKAMLITVVVVLLMSSRP